MKIELVSTDFDGTLVGFEPEQSCPEEFLEWVVQFQFEGGIWIINTGRWVESMVERISTLDIFPKPQYLGCGERELYELAGDIYVSVEPWNTHCDAAHAKMRREFHEAFVEIRAFLDKHTRALVLDEKDAFSGCMASSLEEADSISEYLEGLFKKYPEVSVARNDVYFRFSHANYHKGACLNYVREKHGISAARTFAVGDHYNDIPMLDSRVAGLLACPSNAVDAVKKKVAACRGFVASQPYTAGVMEAILNFTSE
jgi:HAD superfamily hydrolase (TIGR01484 family)